MWSVPFTDCIMSCSLFLPTWEKFREAECSSNQERKNTNKNHDTLCIKQSMCLMRVQYRATRKYLDSDTIHVLLSLYIICALLCTWTICCKTIKSVLGDALHALACYALDYEVCVSRPSLTLTSLVLYCIFLCRKVIIGMKWEINPRNI